MKCSIFLQFVPDFWEAWRCLIYFQADSMVGCWKCDPGYCLFMNMSIEYIWHGKRVLLDWMNFRWIFFSSAVSIQGNWSFVFFKTLSPPVLMCSRCCCCTDLNPTDRIQIRSIRMDWTKSAPKPQQSRSQTQVFRFAFFQNRWVIWVIHTIKSRTIWHVEQMVELWNCHPHRFSLEFLASFT